MVVVRSRSGIVVCGSRVGRADATLRQPVYVCRFPSRILRVIRVEDEGLEVRTICHYV